MNLNEALIQWYKYDKYIENKERELQRKKDELNSIKKQRDNIGFNITKYISSNKIESNVYKIDDSKIEYKVSNKSVSVNKAHIQQCLEYYFNGNQKIVTDVMNLIYKNRKKIHKKYLKRSRDY
jgi:hypothetical protein